MIAAALSEKYNVLKNEGTKNNHIGVPQTLLKLRKEDDICVLEFGTNHKGEIEALSRIAVPTLAVITNVGPSHLEYFTDLEGVYKEKRHILDPLGKDGIAVINGDDPLLAGIKSNRFRVIKYGSGRSNDFRASDISVEDLRLKFRINGGREHLLKLLGAHNVHNALAAAAVAAQFKVSGDAVRRAFLNFKPASMRLNPLKVNGIFIINDSYNSNPASMKTALEAACSYRTGAKWIVSGDMLELGAEAEYFHRLAGKLIADSSAAGLFTFGRLSRHTLYGALAGGMEKKRVRHCGTHDEIADLLKKVASEGDVVLIKGSRDMKMEKVIERLKG
jgi:UDP-N-acetylmuramoyl-tripeptide--D-alanyl-D-alanine ligase